MSAKFTIQQLEALQAKGMIQGFTQLSCQNNSQKKPKKIPKHKAWLTINLREWCKNNRIELIEELKFHPDRKWRFDFAMPATKIAIEYEGLTVKKSGHTTSEAYSANAEKYDQAAVLGWTVLRYTFKNYKTIFSDLEKVIK